jgi:RNA polymerase sigma-70 factor (ECF subfamily)
MKTEEELLNLLKDKNEDAIRLLFDRYYESLCLYAESIVHEHYAAEEIVEELFIYLWVHFSENPINTSVKSYLFRAVHNNCLKYIKKLKKEKKLSETLDYTFYDQEILHPLTSEYPISDLITNELEAKAGEIMNLLPPQCREIYYLNRFENLSYSEIAAQLGITTGTVKTQMSRAFQKFRDELKDYMLIIIALLFFS